MNKRTNNEHHQPDDRITPIDFRPIESEQEDRSFTAKIRLLLQRRTAIITFCVALAGLAILWFIFTARSVVIQITPQNAQLDLSGHLSIKLGHRYLLRPGEYTLTAGLVEYFPLKETFIVGKDDQQSFEFTLTRRPDQILVLTTPDVESQLFVNGEFAGITPHQLSLAPGDYSLELLSERYLPWSEQLEVNGGGKELTQQIQLEPAWANIQINSEPGNAEVSLDGTPLGKSPLNVEILQGEHELSIKSAGYKTWLSELQVIAGEDQQLPIATLEKADGLVTIKSKPLRANVLINGKFSGQTPLELTLTPAQQYKIELFKTGYTNIKKNIEVQSGQELNVALTLPPVLGEVQFKTQPANARLFINGRPRKSANTTLKLAARNQNIEVRADGYVTHRQSVTPKPGFTQRLNIRLKTVEQAKWEAVKLEIVSAAGQKLLLYKPDSFTMGASRREPGRRANETLRPINLTRPFYLATREVTNGEFRQFDNKHSSGRVEEKSLNGDQQPVVMVSWTKAAQYCNWLSKQEKLTPAYEIQGDQIAAFHANANGYRLPTEAEWAWAARSGEDGLYKYAWGQQLPPSKNAGNYADRSAFYLIGRTVDNYDDGYIVTAPVASFQANRRGLYDMGGNVSEWINDYYGQISNSTQKAVTDPLGPEQGKFHVIRDASWRHGSVVELRLSFRDYGGKPRDDLGFRIARYVN